MTDLPKINWSDYDRRQDQPRTRTIAIDWDETFTADPEMWRSIIREMEGRGHTVYIVTSRSPYAVEECDREDVAVIATSGSPKRQTCMDLGIWIDIWIDDFPEGV